MACGVNSTLKSKLWITVAGTAPGFHRIPFSSQFLMQVLRTNADASLNKKLNQKLKYL
jgi:hypothetical protein